MIKSIYDEVRDWADSKKLTNIDKQKIKLIEEIGEFCGAYLKGNRDEMIMELADIMVVTTILYHQQNKKIEIDINNYNKCPIKPKNPDKEMLYSFHSKDPLYILLDIIGYCKYFKIKPENLLKMAYAKIKDRTGKTVNGNFIKD